MAARATIDGSTTHVTSKATGLTQRSTVFAEKKLLEHAETVLVLSKFGDTKEMPRNVGDKISFRRPVEMVKAMTPLTEGKSPAATEFKYEDVETTLDQYGAWTQITDVINDLHEDSVGKDIAMMQGEQAGATFEALLYGTLQAGTNKIFAGGVSTIATVAKAYTIKEQREAVRLLKKNKGKKLTEILSPSAMVGTQAIEASYVAITSTDMETTIRSFPNFIPVASYGSRKPMCPEEFGSVDDVRYVTSPEFEYEDGATIVPATDGVIEGSTNKAAVYRVLIVARHAYGVVPLKGSKAFGGGIKPIVRQPGQGDSFDPLGQTGSVGWKAWHTALILNEKWLVNVVTAASDGTVTP